MKMRGPFCDIRPMRGSKTDFYCRCCRRVYQNITELPLRVNCPKFTGPFVDSNVKRRRPPKISFWDQVKSFSKSMTDFVKDGMPWCVKDHWMARMEVCNTCEHLVNNRCTLCGCKFNVKSKSPSWHCPDNPDRWADVDAKYEHHYAHLPQYTVTALITAYKRPQSLNRLLNSLRVHHPQLAFHVQDTEGNLSRGRNEGVKVVKSEYVLIMEDDFECQKQIDLDALLDVLESDESVALVGGHIREKGEIRHTASDLRKVGDVLERTSPPGSPYMTAKNGTIYRYCDFIANFFLARRDVLIEHPWDERLPLHEHAPWFWSLKQLEKYHVAHTPVVEIVHHRDRPDEEYNTLRKRAQQLGPKTKQLYGFEDVKQIRRAEYTLPGIVLFGVGHSNTSITAQQLMALGLDGGEADETFAEHKSIRKLNRQVLRSEDRFDAAKARGYIAALRPPWVIKDPKFTETLDLWIPVFADNPPLLLWLQKDLNAVYASFEKREAKVSRPQVQRKHERAKQQFENWPFAKMAIKADAIAAACSLFDQGIWQASLDRASQVATDGTQPHEDTDGTTTAAHALP